MNSSESGARRPTSVSVGPNSYKELLVERRGERVLLVRFNRPTVRNALNRRAYYELIRVLRTASHDPTITILVFTGVGDTFCSGNDLKETAANAKSVLGLSDDPTAMENKRLQVNRGANFVLRSLVRAFIFCPKILVALVNGLSIGVGFTLSALCDIVYCTENAYFEAPFTRLGLCPEMCSSYTFPRILGRSKATEVLTLGARLTADEALQYKFVSRVFKNDEVETQFWPKIIQYSMLPPGSMETSKRLITEPRREVLLKAFAAEVNVLEQVRLGQTHTDAIGKFMDKQKINKKYHRTIIVITPLVKFGGQVALELLERTLSNTQIIFITVCLKDVETLRSQLPYKDRSRLIPYACDIHSVTAIKMAVLWVASQLDKVDMVLHLIPLLGPDNEPKRLKPLLCANCVSVERFRTGLMSFFGNELNYVEVEHSIHESPYSIASNVVDIADS